jgi:putative multiple sugar transport system permease protein
MNNFSQTLSNNLKKYSMVFALVVIIILFEFLTNFILLKPENVSRLILQNSYILILAIGMMICILTGGNIDLSVGSVVAFVSAMSAVLSVTLGLPVWLAMILGLGFGLLAGMGQGYCIAYMGIPSFVVTLAGMGIWRGVNNIILNGLTVGLPTPYTTIASSSIPDFIGGVPGINMASVLIGIVGAIIVVIFTFTGRAQKQKKGYDVPSMRSTVIKAIVVAALINLMTYWLALTDGIPIILVILVVLIGIYTFFTNMTISGRHIYAMGGNRKAAELSGVNTKKMLFFAYSNMGLLAGVAGIVYAGRLGAASPLAGQGFELECIAACFVGGAGMYGGVGTIWGAIIGGFIMGLLNNGMSIMGMSTFWQDIIKGLVLLGAVAFDVYSKSRSTKSK